MNTSCPYKPRKVLTEKQAKKQPIGSFYHPTEKTFRSGACPEGFDLRKGYEKKSYVKKDGTRIKGSYVDPICVKNKGLPGKLTLESSVIHINEKNSFEPYNYKTSNNNSTRHTSLLNAVKKLSYSTVIRKLTALRLFHSKSKENNTKNEKLYNIFDTDIKLLQEWRKENPDLYKKAENIL